MQLPYCIGTCKRSRISPRRKCQRVLLLLMLLALWHPTLSTTNNDTIIRRLCTTPAQIRHGDCKPPEPIADPCEPVYGSGLFSEGGYFPSPAENACLTSRERYQAQCNRTGYTMLHNHISKTGGKSLRYLMGALTAKDWRWRSFYFHPPQTYAGVLHNRDLRGLMHGGGRTVQCPMLIMTVLRDPVSRVLSEWFHYGQTQFITKPPTHLPSAPEVFRGNRFSLQNGSATVAMKYVLLFLNQYAHRLMPTFGGVEGDQESRWFFKSSSVSMLFKEIRSLRNTERYWDLMEAYVSHPATANLQVKHLLGYPIYSNVDIDERDVQSLLQMHSCFHSDPDDECRRSQPLLLAGTLERYNSTLEYFAKHLKWNISAVGNISEPVADKNTNEDLFLQLIPGKVRTKDIPEHVIEAIKKSNRLDRMLYDGITAELAKRMPNTEVPKSAGGATELVAAP